MGSPPLSSLLRCPEGKTLEFKRDLSSPRNLLKTLVAFANTAGGIWWSGLAMTARSWVSLSPG